MVSASSGNLTLLAGILMALNLAAGIGLWKAMREHRKQVELQLAMDRCTGQDAHALRDTLKAIESWNRRIRALRAAAAGASLAPPAKAALATALAAGAAIQEIRLASWKARRAAAFLPGGCGIPGFRKRPLPELGYRRPPPDPLGPQALVWIDAPARFQLGGHTTYRRTGAKVEKSAVGWAAQWDPGLGARASLD